MLKSVIIVLLLSVSKIYSFVLVPGRIGHGCSTNRSFVRKVCTSYRDNVLKCVPDPTAGPNSGVFRVFEKCGYCCDVDPEKHTFCTKSMEECVKHQNMFLDEIIKKYNQGVQNS